MIMKKFAVTALCLLLSFSTAALSACTDGGGSSSGSSSSGKNDTPEIIECLTDPDFVNGFTVRGLDSATDSGVCKTVKFGDEAPAWTVAQWWSKNNLKDGEENLTETDYSLKDESKKIAINRKYHSITLALDGSKEFDNYNVIAPAKWPHLLLEQSVNNVTLVDAEKVEAKLDFTLTANEDLRGGNGVGLQAQFAWFIYIVDKNPESEGYGNFLWFGLNIFDSTKLYAPASSQQDTAGGLGNYIYALGANEFMKNRVKANVNNSFAFDILPSVKKGIAAAQANGFMQGTKIDDCVITGMNIGWEVFDRWNESITIFDISIAKTVKEIA